jgi:hypothetical protein
VARRNNTPAVAATNSEPRLWDIYSGLRPTKGQAFREYLGEDLVLQPPAAVKELRAKETEEARDSREDREFDAACEAESKFSRWHFEWFESKFPGLPFRSKHALTVCPLALLVEELTAEEAVALAYQTELIDY